jgi:uncharacterized membrane protein YjgN (DUF898 family)
MTFPLPAVRYQATMTSMETIFLSYVREDEAVVKRLAAALAEKGAEIVLIIVTALIIVLSIGLFGR